MFRKVSKRTRTRPRFQSDEEIIDDARHVGPISTITDLEPEAAGSHGAQTKWVPNLLPAEENPTVVQSTKVDFLSKYATVIDLTVESPLGSPVTELSSDDSEGAEEAASTITAIAEALHAMDSRIITLEEELAAREAGLMSLQSLST
ncbi:MAG: uncharacterized protein KVP18_004042 [Porospora cf. gigantea A]|uniref:uncharacterized protein n=1 Tax=Porospora cf. gigantea A TaxID=2853593 RepID=UPI00355AAC5A|nr:MAG: hypothetical protein KVP18_004042 [Porospora cf. gigantea A]